MVQGLRFLRSLKRVSVFLVVFLLASLFPAGFFDSGKNGARFGLFGAGAAYAAPATKIITPPDATDFMTAYSLYSTGRDVAKFFNGYPDAYVYRSALTENEDSFLQFKLPEAGELLVKIYDYDDLGMSPSFPDIRKMPVNVDELYPRPAADYIPEWAAIEDAEPIGYLYGALHEPVGGDVDCDGLVEIFQGYGEDYRAFDSDQDGFWDGLPCDATGSLYDFIKWSGEYIPVETTEEDYEAAAAGGPELLEPGKYLLAFFCNEEDPANIAAPENARYLPLEFAAGGPEEQMLMLFLFEQYIKWKFPDNGWTRLRNPFFLLCKANAC